MNSNPDPRPRWMKKKPVPKVIGSGTPETGEEASRNAFHRVMRQQLRDIEELHEAIGSNYTTALRQSWKPAATNSPPPIVEDKPRLPGPAVPVPADFEAPTGKPSAVELRKLLNELIERPDDFLRVERVQLALMRIRR